MRKSWTRVLLGLLLVVAGIGYAGTVLNLWHFNLLFDGWWTLFIIVPCLLSVVDHGFESGNVFGLVIGVLLFLWAQDLVAWRVIMRLLLPILLVLLGLGMIFRPKHSARWKEVARTIPTEGAPELTAFFSTENRHITNTITGGASLTAVFGTLTVDLRDSTIERDIVVQSTALFGTVTLLLPPNITVRTDSFSLFGSLANHTVNGDTQGQPTVFISGTNIFGTTEVKS